MNVVSTSHGFVMCFWKREVMLKLAERLLDHAGKRKKDSDPPLCVAFFHRDLPEEERKEILDRVKKQSTFE